MKEIRNVIKCDKCGGTNVHDEEIREIEEKVFSMDDWIKEYKSRTKRGSEFTYAGDIALGVSHMEKRRLVCRDCGYIREYDCVVYSS